MTATAAPGRPGAVRTILRTVAEPSAFCTGCAWAREDTWTHPWLVIRAAARRHSLATGHHTYVTVEVTYQYGPDAADD